MKKCIFCLLCLLSIGNPAYSDNTPEIRSINDRVAQIEKSKSRLDELEVTLRIAEMEGVPPRLTYYYHAKDMSLAMVEANTGHEIFSTRYTYYVEDGRVIKYAKESFNHPDSPPKEAIIYDKNGAILWKNTDEPVISPKAALELFKMNMRALNIFSRY